MKDEILIREIAQMKANQALNTHFLRIILERIDKIDITKAAEDLFLAGTRFHENRLREKLGMPTLEPGSFDEPFEWPDVIA